MTTSSFESLDDLSERDIREAAGQCLVVGFEGAEEEPPKGVADALEQGDVGGVILFRRNVDTVEQVCSLNEHIHRLAAEAPEAPFVAVDQEGGRVVRLEEPLTLIPPMRAVGESGDQRLISEISEVIATEIGALGFNLNFAPVLDVDTNPMNPVIGDRAFSDTPETVARAAGAYLLGHHTAGVLPCGKHFPGHGDTLVDSHEDLP
ncbi:MAG: glycoside hydrolase family 3 N-terminal domain-containing protein, partial [Persicimonas sp.]